MQDRALLNVAVAVAVAVAAAVPHYGMTDEIFALKHTLK